MNYSTNTIPNGVRLLHIESDRPVSWIGVAVDAGTRDENDNENGMAHFVEHMLFKGTTHRKSYHIISRLESIGGQLDAYTTKEETYVYATIPEKYDSRALELLADIILNSTFPDNEMDLERDVVLDEIQSYNDTPSELIYDEFENLLFKNHNIGRNILGTEESLNKIDSTRMKTFVNRTYTAERIVIFYMGRMKPNKFFKQAERHFAFAIKGNNSNRQQPTEYTPTKIQKSRETYQAHCIIGNRCCSMSSDKRLKTILLNNILGGPSMISKLNLAIRERNGLCYNIESNTSLYTDTGVWNIYFGCDHRNLKRTLQLCQQQMDILTSKPLTEKQLQQAKLQLHGQVLIANENLENIALAASKTYLHNLPFKSDEEQLEIIDSISAQELMTQAQELFDPAMLTTLIYSD